MNKEKNKLSLVHIILQGISIWLIGGIIFWLTELIFVLIGLPQSWDYKFVRDGMSAWNAVGVTLLPEKISIALLSYISMSFLGGLICTCIAYFIFKKNSEEKINALIISVYLVLNFYIFSVFWLNIKYLPTLLSLIGVFVNFALILTCIMLTFLCFKILTSRRHETFFHIFFASAVAINGFLFGLLYLLKSYSISILSFKGIIFGIVLIAVCSCLFYFIRVGCNIKFFRKLTLANVTKWVFAATIVLVMLSGFTLIKEAKGSHTYEKKVKQDTGKPNIILIVMDTTRADHLSCYGYHRKTSPHIDKIAQGGILFKNVISPSGWTLPSHASIFTGLFPPEHGAGNVSSYLPENFETLASILKKEGYNTLAYSNNPWVSHFTGLSRGFNNFQEGWKVKEYRYFYESVYYELLDFIKRNDPDWMIEDAGAAKTNRYVNGWIEKNKDSPFFVFINYMEPHLPYNPPAPYNSRFLPTELGSDDKIDFSPHTKDIKTLIVKKQRRPVELSVINGLYDGEINYLDKKIWELYEHLRKLNILENTLLIITSDHGDNLGDHGVVGHAFGLFNTLIDVNLIVRFPKLFEPGLVIQNNVQTTDIFYTVLDVIGISNNPSKLDLGKSLVTRIKQNSFEKIMIAERDRPINTLNWAKSEGIDAEHLDNSLSAIIYNNYKYVESSKGEVNLYNIVKDPDESHNIISEHDKLASVLKNKLRELSNKVDRTAKITKSPHIDKQTKEKLRSLGYIK